MIRNKSGSIENEIFGGSKYKASYLDIKEMFCPIQNVPGRVCQVSGSYQSGSKTDSDFAQSSLKSSPVQFSKYQVEAIFMNKAESYETVESLKSMG